MWLANRIFPSVRRLQARLETAERNGHVSPPTVEQIQAGFDRLGPWASHFMINGIPYGGLTSQTGRSALEDFLTEFPNAATILELGSLEGARTLYLASLPHVQQVTAVEGRAENVEKAKFVQSLLGVNKIAWRHANLETANLVFFGQFEVVYCRGILHHLAQPWRLIPQCATVSPNLFLRTLYADKTRELEQRNGFWGCPYVETDGCTTGLSLESFWLTPGSLYELLFASGYRTVKLLRQNAPDHVNGPHIVLTASR